MGLVILEVLLDGSFTACFLFQDKWILTRQFNTWKAAKREENDSLCLAAARISGVSHFAFLGMNGTLVHTINQQVVESILLYF